MPASRHRELWVEPRWRACNVPFKSPIRASVWCWMQYGRIGVREIGAASIRLKCTQRRGSTGRRGLGVEHATGCIGSRRSLARWNGQAMKSATIVGSPTVTSPGARSLGGSGPGSPGPTRSRGAGAGRSG